MARVAAGAFGFLIFSQAFDGPDLYGALSFLETMPSRPSWHICKGTRSGEVAFKYPQWEETNMKKLALILLAAASLVGTTGAASAQWYGGGYYGDRYYGDRYRQRYYDDDRDYRKRYYRGAEYRGGEYRGGLYYPRNRDNPHCPLNWTIQDGRCQPYRGR
jgi:hypothetical protein